MTRPLSHRFWLPISLVLLLGLFVLPVSVSADSHAQQGGYYYVVQRGDTWGMLSWRTGVPTNRLLAANPNAVRPKYVLYVGERIFIPAGGTAQQPSARASGYWYKVVTGDTWYTVSRDSGVAILDLWHANPTLLRPNRYLWIGDRVWIPGRVAPVAAAAPKPQVTVAPAAPAAAPTATPLPPPSAVPPTATSILSASPTAVPASSTPVPTTSAGATAGTGPTPAATPATGSATPATTTSTQGPVDAAAALGCPTDFGAYADAIGGYLSRAGATAEGLQQWLTACGVVKQGLGGVWQGSVQKADSRDLVIAIHDPASGSLAPKGTLLVYFAGARGYSVAGKADGTGTVAVLKVADLNKDGRPDVVWTDTTCGAHTCFSTLFVDSWDGTGFRSWIEGQPTMAQPSYSFQDSLPGGSGDEIVAHGGVIGSAGAGPQRAYTETYVSAEGGPYRLYSTVYDKSDCLYFAIVDANKAFADWQKNGFGPAIQAYQAAINDTGLKACGPNPDELQALRDFARFRLMVAMVANGRETADQALTMDKQIASAPESAAANAFLSSYQGSHSIVQACRDVTAYAQSNPKSWDFLADWGYANPAFTAEELCPLGQ